MFNHIMIDLETFGTKPGSVIRSIGALPFDPYTTEVGAGFYANVTRDSCEAVGLTVDQSTVDWWSRQSAAAQAALLANAQPLVTALADLMLFICKNSGNDVRIWSQGSNFDTVLLDACFEAVKSNTPWKYFNTRDTRTVYDIAGLDTRTIKRHGEHHNALDDCRFQVTCVQEAIRMIRKPL